MEIPSCPLCDHPYGKRKRCYYCNGRKKTGESRSCEQCGTVSYFQANQLANGEGRFCSHACKNEAQRGVERTKVTRYINQQGYAVVRVGIKKWRLEHRLVVERLLGHPLLPDEHVHHINGVKDDNRPENLLVVTNEEHQRIHDFPQTRPRRVEQVCEGCGAHYWNKASRVAGSRFCSNACRLSALREGNKKP